MSQTSKAWWGEKQPEETEMFKMRFFRDSKQVGEFSFEELRTGAWHDILTEVEKIGVRRTVRGGRKAALDVIAPEEMAVTDLELGITGKGDTGAGIDFRAGNLPAQGTFVPSRTAN